MVPLESAPVCRRAHRTRQGLDAGDKIASLDPFHRSKAATAEHVAVATAALGVFHMAAVGANVRRRGQAARPAGHNRTPWPLGI